VTISNKAHSEEAQPDIQPQQPQTIPMDYVLDLRTVLKSVLKWSWIIVALTLAGMLYGGNEASKFSPSYTARMIISPQTPQTGFSENTTSASAGGLTSKLAAVLGGGATSAAGGMFERLKLAMNSQQLARRLDGQYALSREIFASRWDSEKGRWKPEIKTEPTWRQRLDAYLHQTQNLSQGTEALARAVGGMVQFVPVENTLFWEVKIMHSDPNIALRWLTMIFAEADNLLRDQDRESKKQQVRFLKERVKTAELAGLKISLYGAMITLEKSLHMMETGLPYSATIVETAYASELKTTPNLTKMIAIPALGAGFFGILLVFLFSIFVKEL